MSELIVGLNAHGLNDLTYENVEDNQVVISTDAERKPASNTKNPTLFIGLGGTGLKSIDVLKGLIKDSSTKESIPDGLAFLGLDCDKNDITKCKNLQPNVEVLATTLKYPKSFAEHNKELCPWVTQKTFPSNAEFGAGQYRQVSRMCLMHHFGSVGEKIRQAIVPILPQGAQGTSVKLDVYIVSSICGGAGSGMFIDMAAILRDMEGELGIEIFIYGVFVTGDVYQKFMDIPVREHPRILANTYSCLKEIQYFQDPKSDHVKVGGKPFVINFPKKSVNLNKRLFDLVLLVQGSNRYGKPTLISQVQLKYFLANVLYLMSVTPLSNDHRSKWVNPASGYQYTGKWTNNAPRAFSSFGYIRYKYPEYEFVNYAHGYYGEILLKYFLDAVILSVPEDQQTDPRKISIKDHIQRIVEKRVDDYYEYEDILIFFKENLNNFRFNSDNIFTSLERMVENEEWEKIPEVLEKYETDLQNQIKEKAIDISNAQKKMVFNFDTFLETLPYKLLENGIGVRHMLAYFTSLIEELDEEENNALQSKKELEIRKERNRKEWQRQKEEISALINDKPIWRPKSKLLDIIDDYCRELSEYLNDRFAANILDGIISTFQNMDAKINKRMRDSQKIIKKFDTTLQFYVKHRRQHENILKDIAGDKKAYSNQMEFSVINMKQLSEKMDKFLITNPPRKIMLQLFGRTDEDSKQFWAYNDSRLESRHLKDIIQSSINNLFNSLKVSLSQIAEELKINSEEINSELKQIVSNSSAQWMVKDSMQAGVTPIDDITIAFPVDFNLNKGTNSSVSTSDRVIEVLKMEYAMPSQMLLSIASFKKNFDYEDKSEPNSIHIFPEAYSWPEADVFPGKDDMLQLFALSCAFAYICAPEAEEREELDDKYGKKGYRGFIFQSGNWFILMPYYSLPAHRNDMAENPIKLGMGRINAFREFNKHPEYALILQRWIADRVIGRNIDKTVKELIDYLDDLDKEKSKDTKLQIENENRVIKEYIEVVKKNKSLVM